MTLSPGGFALAIRKPPTTPSFHRNLTWHATSKSKPAPSTSTNCANAQPQLAPDAPLIFRQQDFFYDVPRGRLKLRQFDDGTPAELIFYQRDDRDGPKASYYTRSPVTNPEAMHALLATALTTRGIVTKERHVYLTGRTRIHLDRVDGLGDFVELEVVLGAGRRRGRRPCRSARRCSRSSAWRNRIWWRWLTSIC